MNLVPQLLLPKYGWAHKEAGKKYPKEELSFRQTISAAGKSDRGFSVEINRTDRKVLITFDASAVKEKHNSWLSSVKNRIGLGEINPQPYWGFDDLFHKAGTKLGNCFYVQAEVKKVSGLEYYHYDKILMLQKFSINKFLEALKSNNVLVDFDARTGHNHGTKFRLRQNCLSGLYDNVTEI